MDIDLKDKVPPHNLDAEQAALGALLIDWNALSDVVTSLHSDSFYSFQNQQVFCWQKNPIQPIYFGSLLLLP